MRHNHNRKAHGYAREPIRRTETQLPDYVHRLIAIGETLAQNRLLTIEDMRLKKDEYLSKDLMHGLSYWEMRCISLREVLKDKKSITQAELQFKMDDLKRQHEKQGLKLETLDLEVTAITDLLLEKGIVTLHAFGRKYEQVRSRTPMTGGRIVARAWVDDNFKARLKTDAKAAILGWDSSLLAPSTGEIHDTWIQVVENTERLRNVVVCTLCSCYPRGLLGEPPEWYTSDSYKQRIIKEPRKVLFEMGLKLEDDVEIRVYDSTADMRYMILPLRPKGTEGLSEEELTKLVTRDCLIGVADPLTPEQK